MKLDPHADTAFSGRTSRHPLRDLLRESYDSPERVCRVEIDTDMNVAIFSDNHFGNVPA